MSIRDRKYSAKEIVLLSGLSQDPNAQKLEKLIQMAIEEERSRAHAYPPDELIEFHAAQKFENEDIKDARSFFIGTLWLRRYMESLNG